MGQPFGERRRGYFALVPISISQNQAWEAKGYLGTRTTTRHSLGVPTTPLAANRRTAWKSAACTPAVPGLGCFGAQNADTVHVEVPLCQREGLVKVAAGGGLSCGQNRLHSIYTKTKVSRSGKFKPGAIHTISPLQLAQRSAQRAILFHRKSTSLLRRGDFPAAYLALFTLSGVLSEFLCTIKFGLTPPPA